MGGPRLTLCCDSTCVQLNTMAIFAAFYMCGLEEAAAAEAARTVGMPSGTPYYNPRAGPTVNEQSEFDNPSWALYRYWLSQNPSFRPAQTSAYLFLTSGCR